MGRARRHQPERLADKLKEIRIRLDLSQTQMAEKLSNANPAPRRGHIAEFESGNRQPSLSVLLHYSRLAGVHMEVLVDDELDLPTTRKRVTH
ncbi:MAG: helix-turn-helix transcriptional regulator [Blastocatellia bacterium]